MNKKSVQIDKKQIVVSAIVGALDVHGIDQYANIVASQIADTPKNGYGIVLALQMSARTFRIANDYPQAIETMLGINIPEFLEAITDDVQVRADGMELYNKVYGE